MSRIRRNGEAYSSGDVTISMLGMYDINPSAIDYNYSYAHEYERGIRRDPRAWRMGQKDMACSITLSQDVVFELEKRFRRLEQIRPFAISVVFFNAENEMVKDRIVAKFKGSGRSISQDGALEYEFELFPIDMDFNIQ